MGRKQGEVRGGEGLRRHRKSVISIRTAGKVMIRERRESNFYGITKRNVIKERNVF